MGSSSDDPGLVGDATLGAELERRLSVTGGSSLIEGRDASFGRSGVTRYLVEAFFRFSAAKAGDSSDPMGSWKLSPVLRGRGLGARFEGVALLYIGVVSSSGDVGLESQAGLESGVSNTLSLFMDDPVAEDEFLLPIDGLLPRE
jgi:hypothetical protein